MDDDADLGYFFTRDSGYWTLDMQPQYIEADDADITVVDASSDMLIDISSSKRNYKIGDLVSFKIQYMAALYLLNSDYIEKTIG
jgi:predicted amino acid racemase